MNNTGTQSAEANDATVSLMRRPGGLVAGQNLMREQ